MYVLVLMRDNTPGAGARADHAPFLDSLIERDLVLLGGVLEPPPFPGVAAAYVLRCDGPEKAREIVALDPLVTTGACTPIVSIWEHEGVHRAAIERSA